MERWVFLVMVAVAVGQYCDRYSCKPNWMEWSEGTCGFYNPTEATWYFEDTCWPGEVCTQSNSSSYSNYTCSEPAFSVPTIIYPGDVCGSGRICSNDPYCRSGETCPGQTSGEPCLGPDQYCDSWHYCALDHTCKTRKSSGSTCERDSECRINYGCKFDTYYKRTTGTCTKYFSVYSGTTIDSRNFDKNQNISYFCRYLSAAETSDGKIVCLDRIKLNITEPYYCSSDDDCRSDPVYVNGDYITFSTSCTCGINQSRNKYCNLLQGDSYNYEAFYYNFRSCYTYFPSNGCSEPERLTVSTCFREKCGDDSYFKTLYYRMTGSLYPFLNDETPDCVLKVLYPTYYQLKQDYKRSKMNSEEA